MCKTAQVCGIVPHYIYVCNLEDHMHAFVQTLVGAHFSSIQKYLVQDPMYPLCSMMRGYSEILLQGPT